MITLRRHLRAAEDEIVRLQLRYADQVAVASAHLDARLRAEDRADAAELECQRLRDRLASRGGVVVPFGRVGGVV